jgi:hypothetical protein
MVPRPGGRGGQREAHADTVMGVGTRAGGSRCTSLTDAAVAAVWHVGWTSQRDVKNRGYTPF